VRERDKIGERNGRKIERERELKKRERGREREGV